MAGINLEEVKFLIVDDNAFMRVLIKRILNACGSRLVAEAADGAGALATMKTFEPDIIITDWYMSPLDGLEFVRLLRTGSDSPNPFVPIIMVTAYSERDRVLAARDAGVNEVLVKPLSVRGMYERIVAVVERPRDFVRTRRYFGPDRWRHAAAGYLGPERRTDLHAVG